MKNTHCIVSLGSFIFISMFVLTGCMTSSRGNYISGSNTTNTRFPPYAQNSPPPDYSARIPSQIATKERVVVIDPRVHVWGAYGSDGSLMRAGLATAGNDYCPDTHRACRTSVGHFRVFSLGSPECKSTRYPVGRGGAPMPYCMYFNKNIAMHGSPSSHVVEGNISHGCVRMQIDDAEWLRYNFVNVGTKVIVKPYS